MTANKMRAKPIKYGVLGIGRGHSFMGDAAKAAGFELVAVCDQRANAVAEFAKSRGIAGYTDFDKFMEHDLDIRVVSMPSHALFEQQDETYKKSVLPDRDRTLAIELGSSMSWYKYAGHVYGLDRFGVSAPMKDVLENLSFDSERIAAIFLKSR